MRVKQQTTAVAKRALSAPAGSTARTLSLILALALSYSSASAQSTTTKPQPAPDSASAPSEKSDQPKEDRDPIERADELKSKLTLGVYFTPGARVYDLNLRHQFGQLTAWVAGFYDPQTNKLLRVGAQYDYKKGWFHFVPSLEASTTKAVAGSLYSEMGGKTYAIAGVSRTNLKPFFDLFWDPSESVQLGLGHKISSYDRISGYTIFDVRLHTGQQNTHVVWRHKLNRNNGVTFDGLFKSGRADDGSHVRDVGLGVYYDRPTWFWKLYYDPHVNFTDRTMVRTGIGYKF
jgi:hypothetical protein